jgi:excinuclease ABC subunit C
MAKVANFSAFLKNMTVQSGVYIMRSSERQVLYVGKAKNLKKRLSNYFQNKAHPIKTQQLMSLVCDIEVMITQDEVEALLLESEQIKRFLPRYNVLLKDDKSYPYIHISAGKHPQMTLFRGIKKTGSYFGPYPSTYVVRQSIHLLQKIFRIRTCSNSTYANRSRPCLEYQINRCSAPCVGKITDEDYQSSIDLVSLFLKGKGKQVLNGIAEKMQNASESLNYEQASFYRDQLISLRKIQEKQVNHLDSDIDVIYFLREQGVCCVQLLFVRYGKQVSQQSFFPKNISEVSDEKVVSSFIAQYYLERIRPSEVVLNVLPEDRVLLEKSFKLKFIIQPKNEKNRLLKVTKINAKNSLRERLLRFDKQQKQLARIQSFLGLKIIPNHIECFDISHMMGEATVASCVVFHKGKPNKQQYRQFNIKDVIAGDDYAAMKQVLFRRYVRLKKEQKPLPDLILVDGGLGQLHQAIAVLKELELDIQLVGVAKGEGRKAGLETLICLDENEQIQRIVLPPDDIGLTLINFVRDESHRFAIKQHRSKRDKKRNTSVLDNIEGIGEKKRQTLLNYFGGIQEIKKATIEQLEQVSGINNILAENIFKAMHK